MDKKYKIFVKTLQGHIITFTVESYTIEEGIISFYDNFNNKIKRFSINNIEIEEVQQ